MKKSYEVVLGITGSIATYKAVELTRLMIKKGWNVSVIMTEAATRFVGEITFRTLSRNPVLIDEFEEPDQWQSAHISLADKADAILIAPCTANVIAKMACGIADDALTTTVLACKAPIIVAPAMNVNMWENSITQENVLRLKKRGVVFVKPEEGELACGWQGKGRFASLEKIIDTVASLLCKK
jgi:phosphopantothenoylcysteine decarboxylase/phosphopantothenate--cysteine ligase